MHKPGHQKLVYYWIVRDTHRKNMPNRGNKTIRITNFVNKYLEFNVQQ